MNPLAVRLAVLNCFLASHGCREITYQGIAANLGVTADEISQCFESSPAAPPAAPPDISHPLANPVLASIEPVPQPHPLTPRIEIFINNVHANLCINVPVKGHA